MVCVLDKKQTSEVKTKGDMSFTNAKIWLTQQISTEQWS